MKNAAHNHQSFTSVGGFAIERKEAFMNRLACLAALRKTLRFCVFLLGAIALATPLAFGGVNRWTTGGPFGPFGVSVTSLAIDPVNPETVYAAAGVEVFRSRDGGLSWTASLLDQSGSAFPSGLAIDPLFSSNVYAATDRGVFKSIDAGSSWAAVGPPLSNAPAYSVAVDPITPSNVYAGTEGGLFKSNNRGATWSGRLLASSIYNVVFSPQSPSTIFGADLDFAETYYGPTSPSRLYKSTDGGATWSQSSTDISILPGALAMDPTNSSTLYAGNYRGGGVYKSVNSGSSWRLVSTNLGFAGILAVVIDPRNPSTLYAATWEESGVFRSTDGGVSWSKFSVGLNNRIVTALAIDRTGTRLHAATNDGVFDYQIIPGPVPLDLSVGTDNKAHLLFTDLDNSAVFRSFDNSGNSTSGGPHGPYSGWNARAVADGSDGLTRVLWNNLDGSAALWLLGPTGNLASYVYRPAAGWTAVDVSVGRDGTTHLLWTNIDGRTELTSVAVSGAQVGSATYGPFSGWLARSISTGADGLTRVLWSNTDGRVGLSLIDAGRIVATHRFAPAPGFTARDVAVASDNQARILFVHADGRMALWSVDNSGAVTNSEPVHSPPVSGQTATRISAGADGLTRVLWTSPEGAGTLWLMSLDNVLQDSFAFGGDCGCGDWDY